MPVTRTPGPWYTWNDPRGTRIRSPMSGRSVHDSELGPYPGNARRRRLTVGPWAGLWTTPAQLTPWNVALEKCDDCGCGYGDYMGGTCRITRDPGVNDRPCDCGHTFCACGRPKTRHDHVCRVCNQRMVLGTDGFWSFFPPPAPPVYGDGVTPGYSGPFEYRPRQLANGGRLGDIIPEHQARLARDVFIHVVGGGVYLTTDERAQQSFTHYHEGCWGTADFRDLSTEEIVQRAQETLQVINLASLAAPHPRGMMQARDIRTGEMIPVQSWDQATLLADQRARELITAILDRQTRVGLDVPSEVILVGAGGVGWHVGMQLALIGVPKIHLIDPDQIERSNLTRIPVAAGVTSGKAELLRFSMVSSTWRGQLANMAPHMFITNRHRGSFRLWTTDFAHLEFDRGAVVIDTTDRIPVQQDIYDWAQRKGIRYVRAGYDGGWHVTVSSRRSPDWEVPGVPEGYPTPAWIGGAQIAASLAVIKLCRMPRLEASFSLLEVLGGLHDPMLEVPGVEYRGAGESLEERLAQLAVPVTTEPDVWTLDIGEGNNTNHGQTWILQQGNTVVGDAPTEQLVGTVVTDPPRERVNIVGFDQHRVAYFAEGGEYFTDAQILEDIRRFTFVGVVPPPNS